jgi:hypothetical protein
MDDYRSPTAWGLRDAAVGSPVVVSVSGVQSLQYVALIGKTKVSLQDGSTWTKSGRRWGSGSAHGCWGRRDSADLVIDLERVKENIHEARQERALESLRWRARKRFSDEVASLDGKALAAVIAVLDGAKESHAAARDGCGVSASERANT